MTYQPSPSPHVGSFYDEMKEHLKRNPEWYPTESEALEGLRRMHPEWEEHEFTPIRVGLWRGNHRLAVPRPPTEPGDLRWKRPVTRTRRLDKR